MSLEQKVSLSNANRANRALGKQDYKTLGLSALGGALEFYDFVIYVFFAVVVSKLFFPADMPEWLKQLQTYGIFAAGYLARPLGGIIMAHFGDLLGRKRMFTLSIFLMAIPTLLMGLMPTYATIGVAAPIILLLLRVMQGAAIGGEVPGAWVFVSEHVPARHTGLATGILTSGLTAGILLGSLMAVLINRIYSPAEIQAWAWRIPFIVGGAFGFIAMFLRRWLEETPVFTEMKAQRALSSGVPLFGVFKGNGLSVIVSMLLTWILSAAIVVVILMTPTLIQKSLGITPLQAFIANSWAIIALSIGAVFFGYLADRIGAGKATLLGSVTVVREQLSFLQQFGQSSRTVDCQLHFGRLCSWRGWFVRINDGAWFPSQSSILRAVFFIQYRLCDFWRDDARFGRRRDEEYTIDAHVLCDGDECFGDVDWFVFVVEKRFVFQKQITTQNTLCARFVKIQWSYPLDFFMNALLICL